MGSRFVQRWPRAQWLLAAVLALAVASASRTARAHEGAPTSFAAITVAAPRVLYSLTTSGRPLEAREPATAAPGSGFGADAQSPLAMAALLARHLRIEADGRRCRPGAVDYEPPSAARLSTTYHIEFHCTTPIRRLRVTDDTFDALMRGAHTLLRVSVQGRGEPVASAVLLADESRSAEFEMAPSDPGDAATASRPSPAASGPDAASGAGRSAAGFFPLGVEHILAGWDHLLFLLALVLPGARIGTLVRIVTAFTVAHSLTLAAVALGQVDVPAAPVEALIAASIGWVAVENLTRVRPMSHRWAVAFAFGLVHGFGFANVLRDIGLPRDALFSALLWFNFGIELGQVLVLLLLVPLLSRLGRRGSAAPVTQALSALILVTSAVLLLHRL